MKQLYLSVALVACMLSFSHSSYAQGIYQFWGITQYGGNNDQGVLFSTRYDGTGIVPRQAFEIYTPGKPEYGEMVPTPYNGKLYGMMRGAGPNSTGIIYEYDPAANTYTTKAELYTISKYCSFYNIGTLVAWNNKLYGLVIELGELNEVGILIEFDPATGSLVKKYEFKNATGAYPSTSLTRYNNKLYGCTLYGGAHNTGVLYSFDLATDLYTKLADLNSSIGIDPYGKLAVFNNRLYGTAREGGFNNAGTVFEFNLATNVLAKKADFGKLGEVEQPGGLTLLNNKLYGGALGGAYKKGIVFEYAPDANTLLKKIDLNSLNGSYMSGNFTVYNNKLYGLTVAGGSADDGVLFEYDPVYNTYAKKVIFSKPMGANPNGSLTVLNNRMYSITSRGGAEDKGVLFEYNPGINGYSKKIELGKNNGFTPNGKLTYFNGKLYGTTSLGGDNKEGVIYSYDLATHTYAIRHHFKMATGKTFVYGGMVLHNNKFYGVTSSGGDDKAGVLYEFDPSTDIYTVMHMFSGEGKYPGAVPVVYNNKLYGTTQGAQDYLDGVLYEYDLATGTYTEKVKFGGSAGRKPAAGLTVYNNRLYGTTSEGGAYNGGTLFEYVPAGNVFVKRRDFSSATGYKPYSTMVVYNNMLYGTTSRGGAGEYTGTVFAYDPANNLLKKKHDFLSTQAHQPTSTLAVLNKKLYGMTSAIGSYGILFEQDPVLDVFQVKTEFNSYNGRSPGNEGLTAVPAPAAPGIPGTCQHGLSVTINSLNYNQWVPVIDAEGNAIAEINANGNSLGIVSVSFYTHNGRGRQDAAGRFCLNRNITITPSYQPVTPVSIRLYIKKAEFESLKNTPNSGVSTISDLTIFKNNGSCADAVISTALPLTTKASGWGLDYVYTAQADSLSNFYFAHEAYNTNANYRLQVNTAATANASASTLNIQLNGNPVTGSNLVFQIQSPAELSLPVTIYDLTGKAVTTTQLHLQKGIQTRSMTCAQIPAGVYHAVFHTPGKVHTIRFIRK
jgi:uncharacterized repeat protein (TIGR03803 family)